MAVTRYLLDTNHAARLLDDRAPLWERFANLDRQQVGISMPTVGELWFMVFNSRRAQSNRARLESLLEQLRIWQFDSAAAMEFGRLRTELRTKGRPIPTFDVLIAAIARTNNLVLLTADKHFDAIEKLSPENWLS